MARLGTVQREVLDGLAADEAAGRSPVPLGKSVNGWARVVEPRWARAVETLLDRALVGSTVVGTQVHFFLTETGRAAQRGGR